MDAEPAGVNCAAGGVRIRVGLDNGDGAGTANDGTLHVDEVDQTNYVRNGAYACTTDAQCGGAVGSCQGNVCAFSLTRMSDGTAAWPDQACNPTNSFGTCDTNAQNHADAWATWIGVNSGWTAGVWTGVKVPGCSGGVANGAPSRSMYCGGDIPCVPLFEVTCVNGDQTRVEITCTQ